MGLEDKAIFREEAQKIKNNLAPPMAAGFAFIDPITILMLISIVIGIIQIIQACHQQRQMSPIKSLAKEEASRKQVERVVRRKIGLILYLVRGKDVVDAIMNHGLNMKDARVDELVAALGD